MDCCEASLYEPCCQGQLSEYKVVWHVRPRMKDLAKGYGFYDSTIQVMLCSEHHNAIAETNDMAVGKLPELYGWDEADALDGLVCNLKSKPYQAAHKHTAVQQSVVVCRYLSFNNNELHTALLTYVNGFTWPTFEYHCCDECYMKKPTWRDYGDVYMASLVPIENIIEMVKANPALAMERNAFNKSPLDLIPFLIEELKYSTAEYGDEYVRCHEDGTARRNIRILKELQLEIMEIMDTYAN
jgi:hypothetical protein